MQGFSASTGDDSKDENWSAVFKSRRDATPEGGARIQVYRVRVRLRGAQESRYTGPDDPWTRSLVCRALGYP